MRPTSETSTSTVGRQVGIRAASGVAERAWPPPERRDRCHRRRAVPTAPRRRPQGHDGRDRRTAATAAARRRRARLTGSASTTTAVDFTDATAIDPGSSPSSSTDSAVISDTTRCGPQRRSTRAATRSTTTAVTIPTQRLRAEERAIRRGDGRLALGVEEAARRRRGRSVGGPARRGCGPGRRASHQRRTDSGLTPTISATRVVDRRRDGRSRIVKCRAPDHLT